MRSTVILGKPSCIFRNCWRLHFRGASERKFASKIGESSALSDQIYVIKWYRKISHLHPGAASHFLLTGNFLWKISSLFPMLRFRSSRLSHVALIVGVYQSLEWSNVLSKGRKLRLNWRGCSAWLTVYLFSSISQQTVFFCSRLIAAWEEEKLF